ncbi:MAG: tryptophan synthase subunit beta [Elusimicrobiota bacterium]
MSGKRFFGEYGGAFVPETLVEPLKQLEKDYEKAKKSEKFISRLSSLMKDFAGRPTPLYLSPALSEKAGCRVYLKREDLAHTGSHKINNALGQAMLARFSGKKKIIAETGAGQHGVASATAANVTGLSCSVYMGREDMKRQSENVRKMKLLGAEVVPVTEGSQTLKSAVNAAIRSWVSNPEKIYYLLGSCVGPHPYPVMVRDFQSVIGKELKKQLPSGPTHLVACVGGGSNSIGLFAPFFKNKEIEFTGVEASGAASLFRGRPGILHGAKSYLLYDKDGQIKETHSLAPGLDYCGVGPEHSYYKDTLRARYYCVSDKGALKAYRWLSRKEGIIPALESSHALWWVMNNKFKPADRVVVCLSGRGDKDLGVGGAQDE